MRNLLLAFAPLLLVSCGKKSDFVYYSNPPAVQTFSESISIHEIDSKNKIDILWVIDNSGSMDGIQSNIVANAELFMKEFVKSNYIDWKMGVVSTDKGQNPFLGFATPFDKTTLDPVELFKKTVKGLGTNGSGYEYVFHNIDRHLTHPTLPFLRPNSHLAVIMVTDEKEQSLEISSSKYEVNTFFNTVTNWINPRFKLRFYGAFAAKDLEECDSSNNMGDLVYKDSPFQPLIQMSKGFHMSACKSDFGSGLSSIGKDIASLLEYPKLLLSAKPKVGTIKVTYRGIELPPGKPETGGYWFFDDEFNSIVFYNLNFSQDFENDSVDVDFEINDGIPRP